MKNIVSTYLFLTVTTAAQLSGMATTFLVTNLSDDDMPGSLRYAINQSNLNAGDFLNTISFAKAGTIRPQTDLPAITQAVLIDGYTAPDSYPNTNPLNLPNNAAITVEIHGPGAGVGLNVLNGLVISGTGASGSIIRGLCINNFANCDVVGLNDIVLGAGIALGSDNCTVEGCFLGTGTDGATPLINGNAILVEGVNALIGGALLTSTTIVNASRNLLVGSSGAEFFATPGVVLIESSGPTTVMGNTIGLTAEGSSAPVTDTNFGVISWGGALTLANNIISGHSAGNVEIIMGFVAFEAQTIENNLIGTDITGSFAVTPNGVGIILATYDIENLSPANYLITGNTISGNTFGINLGNYTFDSVTGVQIIDNFIGTDVTGSYSIPNSRTGIHLTGALNTFIGSNVISGNGGSGIAIDNAKNTTMKSNYIGTDVTGSVSLGNSLSGIKLGTVVAVGVPSFGDIVGGALAGEGNLIANNGGYGIQVVSYTQEETIQGNTIIDNALDGVRFGPKTKNNWIGGFRNGGNNLLTGELQSQGYVNLGPLGTSNEIANNGGYGISFICSNGNKVQTNIIVDNGQDGITIVDGDSNLIGGKVALAKTAVEIPPVLGNVITGNGGFGVSIYGYARNNTVLSNEIYGNDDAALEIVP